jgi:hypothetical protein
VPSPQWGCKWLASSLLYASLQIQKISLKDIWLSKNLLNENRIMKHHSLLLPATVAAALSLGSCAPEVPQRVAYNEAAFAGYGGSSSGQVKGRAAAVISR